MVVQIILVRKGIFQELEAEQEMCPFLQTSIKLNLIVPQEIQIL